MKKKIYFLFILCLWLCKIYAQQNAISINNFTLKNQLPASIKDWTTIPAAALLVVQNNNWGDRPLKLSVNIKEGDKAICSNADGIPLDYFKTRSFTVNDLIAGLTNCEELKPGNYTLCVRFRGMNDTRQLVDISPEVCKPFVVGEINQIHSRPAIISPANGKVFTVKEMQEPFKFIYTPVVPSVKNVTYILRVWQIENSKTARQAMLSGNPFIEEKIANRTQYISTSSEWTKGGGASVGRMNNDSLKSVPTTNPTPTPKRDYVVSVQAVDEAGKGIGENNGVSEPAMFSVSVESTIPVIPRVCNVCTIIQWQPGNATQIIQGNNINIIQSFNPSGYGNVSAAKAEITAFERYAGDSCINCNTDWYRWGNFISGTYAGNAGSLGSATGAVTGNTHHSMYWNANSGGSFNLIISAPPLSNLNCCCDRIVITIRYTYTFKTESNICVTCSTIKSYELRKGNCSPGPTPHTDTHNPKD